MLTIEPPAPALATPTANVSADTDATFTPTSSAPCGLTALARIARPSQVRVRTRYSADEHDERDGAAVHLRLRQEQARRSRTTR